MSYGVPVQQANRPLERSGAVSGASGGGPVEEIGLWTRCYTEYQLSRHEGCWSDGVPYQGHHEGHGLVKADSGLGDLEHASSAGMRAAKAMWCRTRDIMRGMR